MPQYYALGCTDVNSIGCLPVNYFGCTKPTMTLGERLKAARQFAKIATQDDLAKKSGVSQQTISKIESNKTDSSAFIVQLAIACGVRPEWLAMEQGEMTDGLYIYDERIKHGVAILEQLKAEYRLDDAIELLNTAVKFTSKKDAEKK